MKVRSIVSLTATGLLLASTFAACGGSSSSTNTTATTGSCNTPSSANPSTFDATGTEDSSVTTCASAKSPGCVLDPSPTPAGTVEPGKYGDIEAPCYGTDYEYSFFHTSTVKGNQLGNLLALLVVLDTASATTTPGLCQDGTTTSLIQGSLNDSLAAGDFGLSMTLTSSDTTYTNDTCAGLSIQGLEAGVAAGSAVPLSGNIAAGVFTSKSPAAGDVSVTLPLPLIPGAPAVNLPLHAVQVSFKTGTAGKISGTINGVLKVSDLPNLVSGVISALPSLSSSTQATVLNLLDKGASTGTASYCTTDAVAAGCPTGTCVDPNGATDPNGIKCQASGDGQVGICEVLCNAEVGTLLTPDVTAFGGTGGAYMPVPGQTDKTKLDSLTVGVGFTANTAH